MRKSFLLWLLGFALMQPCFGQVQATVEYVKESRANKTSHSRLLAGIKLSGDLLNRSKAVRGIVRSCVDDGGQNLVDPRRTDSRFGNLLHVRHGTSKVTLRLRGAPRSSRLIKLLAGEIELFVPANDANATVTVDAFQNQAGRPILWPGLVAAGIEMTMLTPDQFLSMMKERRLAPLVPGDIALRVKDPNRKLIGVEFQSNSGDAVPRSYRSCTGLVGDQITVYHFDSQLPDSTQLLVYVETQAAIVKVPFNFTDLPLP